MRQFIAIAVLMLALLNFSAAPAFAEDCANCEKVACKACKEFNADCAKCKEASTCRMCQAKTEAKSCCKVATRPCTACVKATNKDCKACQKAGKPCCSGCAEKAMNVKCKACKIEVTYCEKCAKVKKKKSRLF